VRFDSPKGDFDEALVGISETGDILERLRLSLLSGLEPGAMSKLEGMAVRVLSVDWDLWVSVAESMPEVYARMRLRLLLRVVCC
jgi:hypothetical protein